jgi:hypothetical protein
MLNVLLAILLETDQVVKHVQIHRQHSFMEERLLHIVVMIPVLIALVLNTARCAPINSLCLLDNVYLVAQNAEIVPNQMIERLVQPVILPQINSYSVVQDLHHIVVIILVLIVKIQEMPQINAQIVQQHLF